MEPPQQKVEFEVCCQKCKYFGRFTHANREPSGECHRRAPGEKYTVTEVVSANFGKSPLQIRRPLEVYSPPVWPWDHCGEFVAAETLGKEGSPQSCSHISHTHPDDSGNITCFDCGATGNEKGCGICGNMFCTCVADGRR